MKTAVVISFTDGRGTIRTDDGATLAFHEHHLQGSGVQELQVGQRVAYEGGHGSISRVWPTSEDGTAGAGAPLEATLRPQW